MTHRIYATTKGDKGVQRKLSDQPVSVPFGSTLCQVSERLSNQSHLGSMSSAVHMHANR